MAARLVVGLFQTSGIALDAYHRLRTEGIPATRLTYRVLKEVGLAPPTVAAEIEALSVDPLVLGHAQKTFAGFIRNGETAVFVQAAGDGEVEFACDIIKLYTPLAIETVQLDEAEGAAG